jgi:hypothetical protein
MRAVPLALLALAVLVTSGCVSDRSIPSDRRQSVKLEAARTAFTQLNLAPVVDEKAGTVVSAWLWCGDKSTASLWTLFPATWARYRATATPEAVTVEGEAWGLNLLLPLANLPVRFPLDQVEQAIARNLKD